MPFLLMAQYIITVLFFSFLDNFCPQTKCKESYLFSKGKETEGVGK